jgi:hypothetical protein
MTAAERYDGVHTLDALQNMLWGLNATMGDGTAEEVV